MARTARKKSESGIYHVMIRGINQQQVFKDDEDRDRFMKSLRRAKELSGFELYAYCLMGNHVHMLIKEGPEEIGQAFKRLCCRYVYWFNKKYERCGHLFQDRYKSEPVTDDAYFFTALRYIHQNPVKAGLCQRASDYPHSSYHEYFTGADIVDTQFVLSMVTPQEFAQMHEEIVQESCLEYENSAGLLTDSRARRIMSDVCGCDEVAAFQALAQGAKDDAILALKQNGLSYRQICRLTGVSFGLVRKQGNRSQNN